MLQKDPLDKLIDDFQFNSKKIINQTTDFDTIEKILARSMNAIIEAPKADFVYMVIDDFNKNVKPFIKKTSDPENANKLVELTVRAINEAYSLVTISK